MLPAAIEDLHAYIASLEDTFTRLSARLAPITSEYPSTAPTDEKNVQSAPSLVNSVHHARNRVAELNASVTALIAHLEV